MPGIDATEEDDDVAYQTLMEADLIVATHNIKMGMLNKSEYEWFSHLAEKMQKEEIQQRILLSTALRFDLKFFKILVQL